MGVLGGPILGPPGAPRGPGPGGPPGPGNFPRPGGGPPAGPPPGAPGQGVPEGSIWGPVGYPLALCQCIVANLIAGPVSTGPPPRSER